MKAILGTMTFADQVDNETAAAMVQGFRNAGHDELDTAYMYCGGDTEKLLGDLQQEGRIDGCKLATKVNPNAGSLSAESVDRQFTTSLERMHLDSVDLLYLHQPDLETPILQTLQALQKHHEAGRFARLGLSNYAAWQVAEIAGLCEQHGFIKPTVYQGMYNALTRDVERELFLCLKHFGIAFYVYNPLAGGMLTGKHQTMADLPPDGRFSGNAEYQSRYWKTDYFEAVDAFKNACDDENIDPASAALRWLVHHSSLDSAKGDAVVVGASSLNHFDSNIEALGGAALPASIVKALDRGWETARPGCIKYFRP